MLILALLFATVSILTIITLKDSQAEIEKFQVKSIAANVSDYHVINDLFINNATLWAENIIAQFANEPFPLDRLQQHLQQLGYSISGIDGIIGSGTRAAIRAFQLDNDMIADGFAHPEVFKKAAKLAAS